MASTKRILWRMEEGGARFVRLTLQECSVRGMAHFRRYLREGNDWTDAAFGFRQGDPADEADPMAQEIADALYSRAFMLATLTTVEYGDCAEGEERPTAWEAGELPEEWRTIDGFLDSLPLPLSRVWREEANALSPGVFFTGMSDAEKKAGRLFVI